MFALLIETSGRSGWVALIDESRILAEIALEQGRRHARDLAPAAGKMLADLALRANQVDCVAVSQGPGSYTGLRVGIASALAFRFATGCHLMLVPTFEIVAQSQDTEQAEGAKTSNTKLEIQESAAIQKAEVVSDALKGWVYHQGFFSEVSSLWRPARPLAVETMAQWEAVRDPQANIVYAGDLGELAAHTLGGKVALPRSEGFSRIVRARAAKAQWDDSDIAEPLYLRPSSAELQMMQKMQESKK